MRYELMGKQNLAIGHLGEEIARKYLEDKGYRMLEQNYKNRYAEIDLVASDKRNLVFVEVKTRIGEHFGSPETSLDKGKIRKVLNNARAYVARKKFRGEYRIDAVCIVLDKNRNINRISHYQNIETN